MHDNQLRDISTVENFKGLRGLHIKNNPIQDMSPIRRLREKIPDLHVDINVDP